MEGQKDGGTEGQKDCRMEGAQKKKFPAGPQKCSNVALMEGDGEGTSAVRQIKDVLPVSLMSSLILSIWFFSGSKFWTQPEGSTICSRRKGTHADPQKEVRRADVRRAHSWYPWRWTGHTGSIFETSSWAQT